MALLHVLSRNSTGDRISDDDVLATWRISAWTTAPWLRSGISTGDLVGSPLDIAFVAEVMRHWGWVDRVAVLDHHHQHSQSKAFDAMRLMTVKLAAFPHLVRFI